MKDTVEITTALYKTWAEKASKLDSLEKEVREIFDSYPADEDIEQEELGWYRADIADLVAKCFNL